ncbi:hypothetical protein [Roseiconus lacunae]|uniref:DUF2628 domain-containing protein n=1 Tax=Roseiconus lacunae TaxID=2605694 RepID=A0ABT7PTC8_9BACT|nr:hypothetical protein [Roseiconus lacunae]MDM4019534.1 hypothetical protein [Roseiconus lacunae]
MNDDLVDDDSVTDGQRETLRYYLSTKGQDISPWFVLQFYRRRTILWGSRFLLLAIAIAIFAPSNAAVSLRASMLTMVSVLFCFYLALTIRLSFDSVEHWRLMRRIIDWNRVRKLYENTSN